MEKKVIYTLALEGYPHELTDLTFPWQKHYADKIGADFEVITKRKFPDWPPTAEKLQLWELGQENDWTIFIDADALINPELFDVTALVPKDTVLFTGQDMAAMRFRPNRYTLRDARYIGACTWFVVCSDLTIDLWRPLDVSFDETVKEIFPTNGEVNCRIGDGTHGIGSDKLIEDYICSNNIARFGLKHATIEGFLKPKFGRMYDSYYWHQYTITLDEKVIQCLSVMNSWGLLSDRWGIMPKETLKKYGDLIQKIRSQPPQPTGQPMMMRPPGM